MDLLESGRRRKLADDAEARGEVADSMEVRLALMARVKVGELTDERKEDKHG